MGNGVFALLKKQAQSVASQDQCRIRLLIVEAQSASARAIKREISRVTDFECQVDCVRRPCAMQDHLADHDCDVVLVGPSWCDDDGFVADMSELRNPGSYALILPFPLHKHATGWMRRRVDKGWVSQLLSYVVQHRQLEASLRETADALFEEKEQARVALDALDDAVIISNSLGQVTLMNPVAESLTGWASADALGRPVDEVLNVSSSDTQTSADHPALKSIREGRSIEPDSDWTLLDRNGEEIRIEDAVEPIHNRDGRVTGAVVVFRDVNHSLAMTQKMAYLAHHDSLTGLPNRMLLDERMEQAMSLARRHHKQAALLFMDLDGFKGINDSLGHTVGDRVLKVVAEKLQRCVRGTDTVCRQGGDEFVILLSEIEHPKDAAQVAEKILSGFAAPLILDGKALELHVSIGISVFPDDGEDVETILRQADAAMYFAKLNHSVSYGFARNDFNPWFRGTESLEHRLFRAFEADEFVLHYQPQIDLVSGEIVGVEALIRWNDPEQGLIYPSQFMSVAERTGLIVAIGRWVIQQACRQVAAWRDENRTILPVAINISAQEFEQPHFIALIQEVLRETGIEPAKLELEFTETVLMNDPEKSAARLRELKDLGIRLAVDNFGAVGSSFRYLRHFPVDTLKVDQCLMSDVTADPATSVVLRSLVDMGRGLKRRLIAEGVETQNQLGFVQAQLFDVAQGFCLARPQDAQGFAQLLDKHR